MDRVSISFEKYDFAVCAGTVCFLGSLMCSLTGQISKFSGIDYSRPLCFFFCGVAVIVLVCVVPCFKRRRNRKILAVLNVVLVVAWVVSFITIEIVLAMEAMPSVWLQVVFGSTGRICSIVLTVQWNLHMASYVEHRAIPMALIVGVGSALLFLVFACAGGIAAMVLVCTATAASALLAVAVESSDAHDGLDAQGEQSEQGVQREGVVEAARGREGARAEEGARSEGVRGKGARDSDGGDSGDGAKRPLFAVRLLFFGSRLLWGVAFGVLLGFASFLGTPEIESPWVMFAAIVTLAFALVAICVTYKMGDAMPALLTTIFPAMLFLLIVMCFLQSEVASFGRVLVGAALLPWFLQMYVQLPSYCKVVRMPLSSFAYLERLLVLFSFEFVAYAIMALLPAYGIDIAGNEVLSSLVGWYAALLVIATTCAMFRHFYLYYPLKRLSEPAASSKTHADELSDVVADLSQEFGISKREGDVMQLLAEGYSRPYIEKRLFISTGTVKSHTYHIYQKLGVNSQDELIEMCKQRQ